MTVCIGSNLRPINQQQKETSFIYDHDESHRLTNITYEKRNEQQSLNRVCPVPCTMYRSFDVIIIIIIII